MTSAWLGGRLLDELRRRWRGGLAILFASALGVGMLGGYGLRRGLTEDEGANADPGPARTGSPGELIAYLHDDVEPSRIAELVAMLGAQPGVARVRGVTAGEALGHLRAALGTHARLLDAAEDGLLPASLELSFTPGGEAAARSRELGGRLRQLPEVLDVDELAPRGEPPRSPARGPGSVAFAGARRTGRVIVVGLAVGASLIWLAWSMVARRRDQPRLLLSLCFTRVSAFLPAVIVDVTAAALGVAAGLGGLRLGWRLVWHGRSPGRFLSPGECALVLAFVVASVALAGYARARVPDPADAR